MLWEGELFEVDDTISFVYNQHGKIREYNIFSYKTIFVTSMQLLRCLPKWYNTVNVNNFESGYLKRKTKRINSRCSTARHWWSGYWEVNSWVLVTAWLRRSSAHEPYEVNVHDDASSKEIEMTCIFNSEKKPRNT